MQRVNQLQNQVQQATNPKAYQQAMQQLQNAMNQAEQALTNALQAAQNPANSPYKVVTDKKVVEFHTGEQMAVRTLLLPLEYDDKGQPKKYSPEDVKKLKGPDPKMPGYEAKLEDLKTGTNVLITLGPTEASSTGKKDPEKKDPDKKEPEEDRERRQDRHGQRGHDSSHRRHHDPDPQHGRQRCHQHAARQEGQEIGPEVHANNGRRSRQGKRRPFRCRTLAFHDLGAFTTPWRFRAPLLPRPLAFFSSLRFPRWPTRAQNRVMQTPQR